MDGQLDGAELRGNGFAWERGKSAGKRCLRDALQEGNGRGKIDLRRKPQFKHLEELL